MLLSKLILALKEGGKLILELELFPAPEPASNILESLFFWEHKQFQEQFQFQLQDIYLPALYKQLPELNTGRCFSSCHRSYSMPYYEMDREGLW